jgi:DNA-binding YbaB/EbfC family protein
MTNNPLDLLKNMQGIQEKMNEIQERIAALEVTGSSGGGMVEIDMNGKTEVVAVRISEEALFTGDDGKPDLEMLGDLIVAAFRQAHDKALDSAKDEIGSVTQSLGLPANFQGLFN